MTAIGSYIYFNSKLDDSTIIEFSVFGVYFFYVEVLIRIQQFKTLNNETKNPVNTNCFPFYRK